MVKRIKWVVLIVLFSFLPLFVNAKENDITMYFFHGDGCPHCAEEEEFISTIEKKYKNLKIDRYEVWYNDENAELLSNVLESYSISRMGVPVTVIGDTLIMGFGQGTGNKIIRAIEYYSDNNYIDQIERIKNGTFNPDDLNKDNDFSEKEKEKTEEFTVNVPLIGKVNLERVSLSTASVIIGFIDGFNPCAMWVLLFLISVLLGMKNRKRMWALGLTFLLKEFNSFFCLDFAFNDNNCNFDFVILFILSIVKRLLLFLLSAFKLNLYL